MKKILVVLLILFVAGGVFAQEGSWSLDGKVEIGTFIGLDNDALWDTDLEGTAVYKGAGYFEPWDWWGPINGHLGLTYNRDALKVGMGFDTRRDDNFSGNVEYNGGSFQFQVGSTLSRIVQGMESVGRLWGSYKLLDELVYLEVAYNSRDTTFWSANADGAFAEASGITGKRADTAVGGDLLTKVDHANFLLADVRLSGLSFGLMLRSIFIDDYMTGGGSRGNGADNTKGWLSRGDNYIGAVGFPSAVENGGWKLADEVMKKAIFGVKFDMQPIAVAAHFKMNDYTAYVGGNFGFGPVAVGASFMGVMKPEGVPDGNKVKVGGRVEYNGGPFQVYLRGSYGINRTDGDNSTTLLTVRPGFWYNVIPSHLRFATDIRFLFGGGESAGEKIDQVVAWRVEPQLFWNFMGTGAGDYWAGNTGMIVRYRIHSSPRDRLGTNVGAPMNSLEFNFRFGF